MQGQDLRVKKYCLIVRKLRLLSYTFASSLSRFYPSFAGLVVHGGEECRAMAEMTLKIVRCETVVFDDTESASRSSVE